MGAPGTSRCRSRFCFTAASEEHFYRLPVGAGLCGWLHSLPIDNSDDLRAALLIHRFSMCIRNQVFCCSNDAAISICPSLSYAESHEESRKRIFLCNLLAVLSSTENPV
ncbi:hypothetical protein V8C42DRAFT_13628 [Trichoderma barbatum]